MQCKFCEFDGGIVGYMKEIGEETITYMCPKCKSKVWITQRRRATISISEFKAELSQITGINPDDINDDELEYHIDGHCPEMQERIGGMTNCNYVTLLGCNNSCFSSGCSMKCSCPEHKRMTTILNGGLNNHRVVVIAASIMLSYFIVIGK